LEGSPPPWASWASMGRYLSDEFYDTMSSSSLSAFSDWTSTDPITADGNILASYEQVELVILSFGLTFRGLWVAQFPDQYTQVPDHVLNSPYSFTEYEKLSLNIEDLISGYAHVYVSLLFSIIEQSYLTVYSGLRTSRRAIHTCNRQKSGLQWVEPLTL
jgi:hypothetical protein